MQAAGVTESGSYPDDMPSEPVRAPAVAAVRCDIMINPAPSASKPPSVPAREQAPARSPASTPGPAPTAAAKPSSATTDAAALVAAEQAKRLARMQASAAPANSSKGRPDLDSLMRSSVHTEPGDSVGEPLRSKLRFPKLDSNKRNYDFFINHAQASGQDQCMCLYYMLKAAGATVWYDMKADNLTAEGMEQGISQSRNLLVFLSDGVMGREYCQQEQRWAKAYDCNIVGVVEKDSRHSPADFVKEKERAPADLKHLLDDVEFVEYRRRDFEARALVDELLKRGKCASTAMEYIPKEAAQYLLESKPGV